MALNHFKNFLTLKENAHLLDNYASGGWFLPLLHPDLESDLEKFLNLYLTIVPADVTLTLYMPEQIYDLDWLTTVIERLEAPGQPEIELVMDLLSADEIAYAISQSKGLFLLTEEESLLQGALWVGTPVVLHRASHSIQQDFFNLTGVYFVDSEDDIRFSCKKTLIPPSIKTQQSVFDRYCQNILSEPFTLIYVPSLQHFEHLNEQIFDVVVLTEDFEVFSRCRQTGVCSLLIQDFLDPNSFDYSGDKASDIAKNWHENDFTLDYQGQNLIRNAQYDLWYVFKACVKIEAAFRAISDQFKIEKLILFDEFSRPQFWDPAFGPFPDVKNAMLASLADHVQICWTKITPPQYSWIRKQIPSIFASEQESGAVFADLALLSEIKSSYKHIVLGVGSHIDLAEQGTIAQELWQREDTLYVFLRTYLFPVTQKNAVFADLSFFLDGPQYIGQLKALELQIAELWKTFESGNFLFAKKYPSIFENPYLKFQFQAFFNQLLDNARYVNAANWLNTLFHPALYILGNGAGGVMKSFTEAAQPHQTLRLFHGTGGGIPEALSATRDMCVKGSKTKERMAPVIQKMSIDSNILVVGDLRENNLFKSLTGALKTTVQNLQKRMKQQPTIMILTSHLDYGLYTGSHRLSEHYDYWQGLEQIIKEHSDYLFLIRYHPRYDYASFYNEIAQRHENLILLDTAIRYDYLEPSVTACILMNQFSTVVHDVYRTQKPLVFLTNPIYRKMNQHSHSDLALNVENITDLKKTLESLLKNPAYVNEVIEHQNKILAGECSFSCEEGSQRLLSLIIKRLNQQDSRGIKVNLNQVRDTLLLNLAFEATRAYRQPSIWKKVCTQLSEETNPKRRQYYADLLQIV